MNTQCSVDKVTDNRNASNFFNFDMFSTFIIILIITLVLINIYLIYELYTLKYHQSDSIEIDKTILDKLAAAGYVIKKILLQKMQLLSIK